MKRNLSIVLCIMILLVLTISGCGKNDDTLSDGSSSSNALSDLTANISSSLSDTQFSSNVSSSSQTESTVSASSAASSSSSARRSSSSAGRTSSKPTSSRTVTHIDTPSQPVISAPPASTPSQLLPPTSTPPVSSQPEPSSSSLPSSVPETPSSTPSSSAPTLPVYDSVADFIEKNSDMIEEMKASIQQEDMTVDVYARENSMVFSIQFMIDIGDTSLLKEYFEQYFAQLEPSSSGFLDEMRIQIPSAESIIFELLDVNGNMIASKEFK